MFIDILVSLIGLFSRQPNVSQKLREQTINIIVDLVNDIAPGYLPPNRILFRGYQEAIYKRVYKSLSDELGVRRFENINYRDQISYFLREVPSEDFFNVTEYLLKEMYRIVHIQITIPDDIALNPYGGEKLWSRKASVRDRHISLFKGAVDKLNHRLSQSNFKHHYELSGESIQMIGSDTGLEAPEEDSSIQKKDDNQTPVHHQNQEDSGIQEPDNNQTPVHHQNHSRSEFWHRRGYRIAVVGVIVAILVLCFGEGILIRPLHWGWNHLQTVLPSEIWTTP